MKYYQIKLTTLLIYIIVDINIVLLTLFSLVKNDSDKIYFYILINLHLKVIKNGMECIIMNTLIENPKKIVSHKKNLIIKLVLTILIWLLSFYTLSVKFWQGDINVNYWIFIIDILRWFSVWATIIALIWSSWNFLILIKKNNVQLITSYNFKTFSLVYNLMAGIIFWCGIFTYGWNDYIVKRTYEPLSFSATLIGHSVIPILLIIYFIVYCDYFEINRTYYKKNFWLVLIFPFLYAIFMLLRSFYLLHQCKIRGINVDQHLDFISPYWFLSWFVYGWGYWIGSMLVFLIIILVLALIINTFNNLIIKKVK